MAKTLIRFARKRLSAWEPEYTDEDVQQVEFRTRDGFPDLRPSVYEIDLSDLVRACAEHSTLFDPPNPSISIDLGRTGRETAMTLGATGFRFTEEAHREILLTDTNDLMRMIRDIRNNREDLLKEVTRGERVAYANHRLKEGDPEWIRALQWAKDGSWLKKLTPPVTNGELR